MRKVINYGSVAASVIGIIAVILAGIKLSGHHYNVACEGIITGICLVVLFISAVMRIAKQDK